jgi:hypothetical protein
LAIDGIMQTCRAVMPAEMFVNSHGGFTHHFERERQVIGYAERLADLERAGADSFIGIAKRQIKQDPEVKKLTLTGLTGGQPGT